MKPTKTMTVAEYKAALVKNPRKVAGKVNAHTALVKAIVASLNLIPGVDAIPMNTGEIHREGVHVKYGFPGMFDIMVRSGRNPTQRWDSNKGTIHVKETLWIEVKTGTGRLSAVQVAFKEMITRWGDRYLVCRSVDDAEKAVGEIFS